MKVLLTLFLATSLMLFGCSKDESATAPAESLNYDIISDESPNDYETALSELTALSITVPDPVTRAQLQELQSLDLEADLLVVENAALDEEGRPNFRRIINHLHDQFTSLRRCLANSDNPRLQRIAYGAHLAMRRGMRALQAGEYRLALQYFRQTNRLLNLANELCRGRS